MNEIAARYSHNMLDEVLPLAFDYARRKKIGDARLKELYQSYLAEDQDEENLDMMAGMLVAGSLFTSAKLAGAFLRSQGDELSEEVGKMARMWRKTPWTYMAVDILERIDDSPFFRMKAMGGKPKSFAAEEEWPEFTLYSPALRDLHADGYTRFFSLYWRSQECWHSYGPIIPLPQLESMNDLCYYAEVSSPNRKNSRIIGARQTPNPGDYPLSERITSNPIPWIRLIEISGLPKVRNPRFTMGIFASYAEHPENPADEPTIQNAAEKISDLINTSKFLARLRMLDDPNVGLAAAISIESPHRHADMSSVYIHQGTVYLKSIARESYDEIREVLEPIVQLPEDPMLDVTFGLYTFADDWYAATDTLHLLIEAFDDEIFDGDEEDLDDDGGFPNGNKPSATMPDFNITTDLDTINAVSAELITARNAGEEPDISRIMKNTGASRSNVEAIQKMIEYSLSNMGVDTDIPGPFDLPPAAVHALTSPPLEEAEGLLSLKALSTLDAAAFEDAPVIKLYRRLIELAESGGFIPATAAGYIKPAFVKKLAQILPDQLGYLEPEEVKKESDWFWLERMRNLLTSADILLVESKGFRLAYIGTDPVTIKDMYLRTLSALFRHHPWETHPRFNFDDESWIPGTSALLLYGLKYLADNNADHRVYDYEMAPHLARYVPEYRETLRDDPDQDPRKFDTPMGYLRHRVISLFFQQFCIPLGLAERVELEPLEPQPVVPTPLLDALVRLRT